MYSKETTVLNKTGLHARPAAEFARKATQSQSKVTIENMNTKSQPVNAKSILLLLSLCMGKGTSVRISAEGPDEEQTVNDLVGLIEGGFGEL